MLVILPGAAFPSPPSLLPAQGGWTVEPILSFGGSSPPDVQVDSGGAPHILACPPGSAWYASRAAGSWSLERLTDTIGGGLCGRLALGPGDVPFASLFIPPTWDPSHFYLADRSNGTWRFLERPRSTGDLAVDALGAPHIASFVRANATHWALRYYSDVSGTWNQEDADAFYFPSAFLDFGWVSLALDAQGNPRILFYDSAREDVRYATRDATGWHVEVIEHIGGLPFFGQNGGLTVDSRGLDHAIYLAMTGPVADELRYAVRTPGGWSIGVVDTQASYPAIAIGPEDRTHVSYVRLDYFNSSRLYTETRLLHAVRTGATWAFDTVLSTAFDGAKSTGTAAQFTAMAVDRCDNPHIAYYYTRRSGSDITGSGVYYATRGEPCGLSPLERKHEAITGIRALKDQALLRGDGKFLNQLDEAEEEVWESLGFNDPFRPNAVAAISAQDVTAKARDRDKVRLTLGPSWDPKLPSYKTLRLTWSNGVVTTLDLPKKWPDKQGDLHEEPWVDAWHQDVRVHTERDKKVKTLTLDIRAHQASLGFTLSLDTDRVADLSFTYRIEHLWIDSAHLDPKEGKEVFDEEEDAVEELVCRVGEKDDLGDDDSGPNAGVLWGDEGDDEHKRCRGDDDDHGGSPPAVLCRDLDPKKWTDTEVAALDTECDRIANLLVKADEILARTALDDAKGTPIQDPKHAKEVQHEIEKAERELKRASSEWDEHEYDDAIRHFGEAWEHAQHAIIDANKK